MTTSEKRIRLEEIFELQKKFIQNISLENYFDTLQKVRQLELQKEMIKAIPTTKNNYGISATEFAKNLKTVADEMRKINPANLKNISAEFNKVKFPID